MSELQTEREVNGSWNPFLLFFPDAEPPPVISPPLPAAPVSSPTGFPASQGGEEVVLNASDWFGGVQVDKGAMYPDPTPLVVVQTSEPQPVAPPSPVPTVREASPVISGGSISTPPPAETIDKVASTFGGSGQPFNAPVVPTNTGFATLGTPRLIPVVEQQDVFYNTQNNDSPIPQVNPFPNDLVTGQEATPSMKTYEGKIYESPVPVAAQPNELLHDELVRPFCYPVPYPKNGFGGSGYYMFRVASCTPKEGDAPPIAPDLGAATPTLEMGNTLVDDLKASGGGPEPETLPVDREMERKAAKIFFALVAILVGMYLVSGFLKKGESK